MAKGLRSKWKKQMRAIKRERYAKKELQRLKNMLGIKENGDVMKTVSEIATVVDAKTLQKENEENDEIATVDAKTLQKENEENDEIATVVKTLQKKNDETQNESGENEKKNEEKEKQEENSIKNVEAMDIDESKSEHKIKKGGYPVWMGRSQIKKLAKANKLKKKKAYKKRKREEKKKTGRKPFR